MHDCLVTFRSVTPAQRGEGILRRAGFYCTLSRTPKWMEEQGCGYSLRVRHAHVENCVERLRSERVPFRKVYLLRENGRAEELEV